MNPDKLLKWNTWQGCPNTEGSIIYEITYLALIRKICNGLEGIVSANESFIDDCHLYTVL